MIKIIASLNIIVMTLSLIIQAWLALILENDQFTTLRLFFVSVQLLSVIGIFGLHTGISVLGLKTFKELPPFTGIFILVNTSLGLLILNLIGLLHGSIFYIFLSAISLILFNLIYALLQARDQQKEATVFNASFKIVYSAVLLVVPFWFYFYKISYSIALIITSWKIFRNSEIIWKSNDNKVTPHKTTNKWKSIFLGGLCTSIAFLNSQLDYLWSNNLQIEARLAFFYSCFSIFFAALSQIVAAFQQYYLPKLVDGSIACIESQLNYFRIAAIFILSIGSCFIGILWMLKYLTMNEMAVGIAYVCKSAVMVSFVLHSTVLLSKKMQKDILLAVLTGLILNIFILIIWPNNLLMILLLTTLSYAVNGAIILLRYHAKA